MLEKANHICTAVGALLHQSQQGARARDAADDRQVIPRQPHAQDGGLPTGRISANHGGQEIEARLVYPDDGSAFFLGPLFIAGHRSVYHAAMAASSRWVARRIGFWTLQAIARRRRLTCAGW